MVTCLESIMPKNGIKNTGKILVTAIGKHSAIQYDDINRIIKAQKATFENGLIKNFSTKWIMIYINIFKIAYI
jgi:hypothetical protein